MAPQPDASRAALTGKKILVGVTGGIAAYKTCTLVSRLAQSGANVRVMMTEAAARFVGPLTFQALSGQPVVTSIWQSDDHPESQHVGLARWCDLLVIAPASADAMAKIAAGITDDVVSLVASALPRTPLHPRGTPVVIAPAMNAEMWAGPVTQRNVATLKQLLGFQLVGPDDGWQACRTSGPGRMSEPGAIFEAVCASLAGVD